MTREKLEAELLGVDHEDASLMLGLSTASSRAQATSRIHDELRLALAGWRFVKRGGGKSVWLRIEDGIAQTMEIDE